MSNKIIGKLYFNESRIDNEKTPTANEEVHFICYFNHKIRVFTFLS